MPRVLALVHGMGVNVGTPWAALVVDQLNTVARRYTPFPPGGRAPFVLAATPADVAALSARPDQVVVVPAGYDAVLRRQVNQFQQSTSQVTAAAASAGIALPSDVRQVLSAFANAGETERNFFWSHAMDVVAYRYFVPKAVQAEVAATLAALLALPDVDLSVMAHSLGTAVVHDVVARLALQDGVASHLRPPGVRLQSVFMLANVSRVLEGATSMAADVAASPVAPPSVRGDAAAVWTYVHVQHPFDPFPLVRRFAPPWPADADYVRITGLRAVAAPDAHDWTTYLADPAVHVPILNALFNGTRDVPGDEAARAAAAYDAAPSPLCAAGKTFWSQAMRSLADGVADSKSVGALLGAVPRYFAVLAEARRRCAGAPLAAGVGGPFGATGGGLA